MSPLVMKSRIVVGMGELLVSGDPGEVLITYALGSCLGITVHDPVARVGGMLHVMLPESSINPEKRRSTPAMFVDSGVPLLFQTCYRAGGVKERLVVKVAGGATSRGTEGGDQFEIGKRNFLALKKLLWKNGVLIKAHDVGGDEPRTMSLDIGEGDVILKTSRGEARL
jgi:chemotaxis protein CheD